MDYNQLVSAKKKKEFRIYNVIIQKILNMEFTYSLNNQVKAKIGRVLLIRTFGRDFTFALFPVYETSGTCNRSVFNGEINNYIHSFISKYFNRGWIMVFTEYEPYEDLIKMWVKTPKLIEILINRTNPAFEQGQPSPHGVSHSHQSPNNKSA